MSSAADQTAASGGPAPGPGIVRKCPKCLVIQAKLQWRCHSDCPIKQEPFDVGVAGEPRMISTLHEQSYPCPHASCSLVHTWPYLHNCAFPYGEPLKMAVNAHHVSILALDGSRISSAKAAAAHVFGWEMHQGTGNVRPFGGPALASRGQRQTFGINRSPDGQPFAFKRPKGDAVLYVHGFELEPGSAAKNVSIDGCPASTGPLIARLLASDTVTLSFSAETILSDAGRKTVHDNIAALCGLAVEGQPPASAPTLAVMAVDEDKMAQRLGVAELPALSQSRVIEGYVLDGLRVRELIQPLLNAFNWQGVEVLCCRAPFDNLHRVRGLGPWLARVAG